VGGKMKKEVQGDGGRQERPERERERATLSRFIDFSHRKGEKSGE